MGVQAGKLDMETLTLARFILESSLMHYDFVPLSESRTAAAALLLALRINDKGAVWVPNFPFPFSPRPSVMPRLTLQTTELEKYSGFKGGELEEGMWQLNKMLLAPVPKTVKTIKEKYSHEVFSSVAKKAPLEPPPVLSLL